MGASAIKLNKFKLSHMSIVLYDRISGLLLNREIMKKLFGILILTMALVIACDRDDDDNDDRPPNEVWMSENSFIPVTLTVSEGTTVRWVNNSTVIHNVVHDTGMFNELLNPGQAYSFTFENAGTYNYECTIHPGMIGTIVVE